MSWQRPAFLAILAMVVGAWQPGTLRADDGDKKAEPKAAAKDDAKKDEEKKDDEKKEDIYAIPKDADGAALLKIIEKVQSYRPTTREEAIAHRTKALGTIKNAAKKILETEKDKTSETYRKGQFFLLSVRVNEIAGRKPDDQKRFIDEAKEYLSSQKEISRDDAFLAMMLSQQLEFSGKTDLAKDALTSFSEILGKASIKDDAAKQVVEGMAGSLRRMNLPGNTIEIKGKMVDGKDFDWAAYSKDKVVLVDFWATWCGPCRAELPNVKANYEKYHSKGFDVIGISLDTDRKKLEEFIATEKLPWTQLFEDNKGWAHPVAKHYGIQGIPTVILVGKDGKVVSLSARGPELGKLLEKLLGPADAKPEAASTESGDQPAAAKPVAKKKAA